MQQILKSPYERSPTLDTVLMVERTIEDHSGEFNKTKLWKKLPKKVMWQNINKIAFDREGKIAYIWNPELAKKLMARKEIKL
ncbi:hypothetical protein J4213_00700 [Candidatus Woesearchaeota archaeon]|nr:hypothetical protein [Candidatus Woesearchaeota archaeon]